MAKQNIPAKLYENYITGNYRIQLRKRDVHTVEFPKYSFMQEWENMQANTTLYLCMMEKFQPVIGKQPSRRLTDWLTGNFFTELGIQTWGWGRNPPDGPSSEPRHHLNEVEKPPPGNQEPQSSKNQDGHCHSQTRPLTLRVILSNCFFHLQNRLVIAVNLFGRVGENIWTNRHI